MADTDLPSSILASQQLREVSWAERKDLTQGHLVRFMAELGFNPSLLSPINTRIVHSLTIAPTFTARKSAT